MNDATLAPTQEAFVRALVASERHSTIKPEDDLFGQFVGSWDLSVEWLEDGKVIRREAGEWVFSWILEGRVIQDVWTVPKATSGNAIRGSYEYGTSIRVYEPANASWRSIWVGPVQSSVRVFHAFRLGEEIILEGIERTGNGLRWIFSEIDSISFKWRFERQTGANWTIVQRFNCKRLNSESRTDLV